MGDAAGIGPEVVLKALSDKSLRTTQRCVIIGDANDLRHTARSLKVDFELSEFNSEPSSNRIEVFDLKNLNAKFEIGADGIIPGVASAQYIESAVSLWRGKEIDAICTAPISKKAINLGGFHYSGHTEFLAALTETSEFAMSFFADSGSWR